MSGACGERLRARACLGADKEAQVGMTAAKTCLKGTHKGNGASVCPLYRHRHH